MGLAKASLVRLLLAAAPALLVWHMAGGLEGGAPSTPTPLRPASRPAPRPAADPNTVEAGLRGPPPRPLATAGRPPVSPPADPPASTATCRLLSPSPSPRYSVQLCQDPSGCGGYFEVRRLHTCRLDAAFSAQPDTLRYVRERCGPDTFNVRLEGPEVVMADVRHEGHCQYRAAFRLRSAGEYRATAVATYANYDAFNDRDPRWHPLLNETIVAPGTALTCRAAPQPTASAVCAGGDHPGRWVRANASAYRWAPDACRYGSLGPPELGRCLRRKRLLFAGDSQLRATFIAFLTRVYRSIHDREQVLPLFSRHDDTRFEVNGVQLDFIVDQFLYRAAEALATRQRRTANFTALQQALAGSAPRWWGVHADQKWPAARPYDWVVVCVGQHFAANSHWPLAAFQRVVQGFLEIARGVPLIWLTIPAFPLRNDMWVKSNRDWRNSHRFAVMNEWLRGVARRYPTVRLVDYFGPTYPMLWTSRDLAHFHTFPQDAVVDILLHMLCVTPPQPRDS
eukprot:EG_transcript_9905